MGFLNNDGLSHFWDRIKVRLSAKQDKLTGTQGQVVGFDATGDAVSQDAPITGITQEEADSRYLQLIGGTVNGEVGAESISVYRDRLGHTTTDTQYVHIFARSNGRLYLTSGNNAYWEVLDPVYSSDAANKKYVDEAINTAINGAIEEAY